jgi:tripartite-type tricarboxylate transporter receptor subunit TctC
LKLDTETAFSWHPHPHPRQLHRQRQNQRQRRRLLCALACAPLAHARAAEVPAWPTKPLRIVVGFPGGSTPDIAARVLAEPLARVLGQPVIVDNRPGAAGNIAADQVAKATDDHTLGVVINGNLTSARLLNPRLPFDPARDFALLSLLASAPLVLVGAAHEPGGAAFLEAARQAGKRGGGGWNYGSVGIGSVGHLGMELIRSRAGFAATHVPYSGNPAVLTALISGQIQAALVPPGLALPQVRAGKVQAIGLTGGRSTLAPDVPPLSALGVPADELQVWVALVGPRALSSAARERLAREVGALLREDSARQRLFSAGWQVQASSAQALARRVQEESRILGDIIRQQRITAD